jgi:glyoxylase I family protein
MIVGIEHTAIVANDVAALADWYVDTLGFVINYRSPGATFVRAQNGTMIEIFAAEFPRGEQQLRTQGIRHLALTVADFDAAYETLKTKNVNFVSEPMESKGNRVVFFTDPEGNYLHLLHRQQPMPEKL